MIQEVISANLQFDVINLRDAIIPHDQSQGGAFYYRTETD